MHKYIQRFTNVRLKIPKVSHEAIISAFSDGIRDVKMKEPAIHEDMCLALQMFNMAARCAWAEEGRLFLLELSKVDPEDKKAKAKKVKRKGPAVLVAEPEMKRGRDHDKPSKGNRPFCVFHNDSHNTNDCQELRAIRDGRIGRRPERVAAKEATMEATETTATTARTDATNPVKTAGRASLVMAPGETSLVRTVLRAMPASLDCRRRQGETMTTAKMMGPGASKSLVRSPASWVALRLPPLITSSSSSLVR